MLEALTIKDSEKFLRQKSKIVDFTDKDLEKNIKDIEEYCKCNNNLYAMACIQLGIPKRIIYIKSTKANDTSANLDQEQFLMINQKVLSMKGRTEFWEACVSGLTNLGLVERPYEIEVEYQNKNGEKLVKKFEGFSATVISHELDHLDGIFHMDRAKRVIQLPASQRFEFRKNQPYKVFSKTCKFEYKNINLEGVKNV